MHIQPYPYVQRILHTYSPIHMSRGSYTHKPHPYVQRILHTYSPIHMSRGFYTHTALSICPEDPTHIQPYPYVQRILHTYSPIHMSGGSSEVYTYSPIHTSGGSSEVHVYTYSPIHGSGGSFENVYTPEEWYRHVRDFSATADSKVGVIEMQQENFHDNHSHLRNLYKERNKDANGRPLEFSRVLWFNFGVGEKMMNGTLEMKKHFEEVCP